MINKFKEIILTIIFIVLCTLILTAGMVLTIKLGIYLFNL